MVVMRRRVALAGTALLLAAASGCGGTSAHHSANSHTSGGSQGSTPGSTAGASKSGSTTGSKNGTKAGAKSDVSSTSKAGVLPATAYDDTSGTTAAAPKSQKKVLALMPGSASGKCVVVGSRTDVRSGAIAMGNFADARAKFKKAKSAYDAAPAFFYVIPQARNASRVKVTVTKVNGTGKTVVVKSHQVEEAAQWKYFPINVTIPATGNWRFSVVSGAAHGCFEASFTSGH